MTHYYDITQNNTFSIKELKEEEIQNIDFCSSSILKKCMNKTNLYNYNQNDYLGIMIHNNIVHYLTCPQSVSVFFIMIPFVCFTSLCF